MISKKKIIIIDDEEMILELLADFFETSHFIVQTFSSPITAFEYIQNNPEHFDFILSDFKMPGMNGGELFQGIFDLLKIKKPFVIMTGEAELNEQQLLRLGVKKVFYKPIKLGELVSYFENL